VEVKNAPILTPVMTYYADLVMDAVGKGPFGTRSIATVTGGEFSGDDGGKGTIIGAGADWLLSGDDGFGRLDVRANLKTSDGAVIYAQYHGYLELTPSIRAALAGEKAENEFGEQYFFTNPRLETGDERWAWVNHTFFIGQGRLITGPRVEYQVFRVDNPS